MLSKILSVLSVLLMALSMNAEEVIYKVGFQPDLVYLEDGRAEKLDIYYPVGAKEDVRHPAVVIIHGGGWSGGTKNGGREANIGANLARMGYVSVSIDYLLASKSQPSWPLCIQDCKKAVQWLRVNADKWHVNGDKIGCIGGSAGGHLSALLSTAGADCGLEPQQPYPGISSRVQACVNLYGIMDVFKWRLVGKDGTPLDKFRFGSQNNMFGKTMEEAPEMWKLGSPIHQADKNDPPVFSLHGKMDTTVDYYQAIEMDRKYSEIGVEHELMLLDGIGHTFSMQTWGHKVLPAEVRKGILSFFDRHLKGLSPADADRGFDALVAWEKANPQFSHYGSFSCSGILKSVDGEQYGTIAGQALPLRITEGTVLLLETPSDMSKLASGMECEIRGNRTSDDSFRITGIHYYDGYHRGAYAAGQKSARGEWRVRDGKSEFFISKKQTLKLSLEDKVLVFRRCPGAPSIWRPGAQITYSTGRSLGDMAVIDFAIIRESGKTGE